MAWQYHGYALWEVNLVFVIRGIATPSVGIIVLSTSGIDRRSTKPGGTNSLRIGARPPLACRRIAGAERVSHLPPAAFDRRSSVFMVSSRANFR